MEGCVYQVAGVVGTVGVVVVVVGKELDATGVVEEVDAAESGKMSVFGSVVPSSLDVPGATVCANSSNAYWYIRELLVLVLLLLVFCC